MSTGPETGTIRVEVAYATPERQLVLPLDVPRGCTVGEAIERSAIREEFPGLAVKAVPAVPVAEAVTTLATSTTYGVAPFVRDAALFALRQGDAFEDRIAAPFRRRRQIALDRLTGANRRPHRFRPNRLRD